LVEELPERFRVDGVLVGGFQQGTQLLDRSGGKPQQIQCVQDTATKLCGIDLT
jgi:hypothetical protein